MTDEIIKYFRCSCGSEVMVVDIDKEYDLVYISIYEQYNSKNTFWNKLRHIWRILWYGNPWGDEIVLTKEDAIELGNFLTTENFIEKIL